MNLRTLAVFVSLVVSSDINIVSATPLSTVGAAYFQTNEPTGNFIISADISSNGALTFANAVSAGGKGAHLLPDLTVNDPFNSQGSVGVSQAGNFLAAVNAGSNTVAIFSIDSQRSSTLKMIGSPVPSGGGFPVSLAITKNGKRLCVLNGGAINGVQCFSVDQRRGLSPLANTLRSLGLNLTTPATGAPGTVSDVLFNEDETRLIVAVKAQSLEIDGFLATWDVAPDGSLSSTFTQSGPPASSVVAPFGMTLIPGKNAIIAAEPLAGYDIFAFNGNNDAASSTIFPIEGQTGPCWVTFSPSTGNFFVSDPARSFLTEVHVDDNLNGTVVAQYPQANGTSVLDSAVATMGNRDYLYVLSANSLTIEVASAAAPGQLKHVQSFDFSAGAQYAGVPVSAPNVAGIATFVKGL